jgi:hypothetical protein
MNHLSDEWQAGFWQADEDLERGVIRIIHLNDAFRAGYLARLSYIPPR